MRGCLIAMSLVTLVPSGLKVMHDLLSFPFNVYTYAPIRIKC